MPPTDVRERIEAHLGTRVRNSSSVGGGCISNATQIRTDAGDFFLKWSTEEAALTFPAEAAGLEEMRKAHAPLVIPEPLLATSGDEDRAGMLLLPWIVTGSKGSDFWDRFGAALAKLHRYTSDRFGFDRDNFIGRLPQENTWETSWVEFFRRRRLAPQVERARHYGRWNTAWDASIERLYTRLSELLPHQPDASILHGDLWSGNYMVNADGRPVLIDPASYYGHREADLAMTELLGGFDRRFYAAYRDAWPLEPGYEERREIYNLYHLLNHLNHFGGGYAGSVGDILGRF